MFGVFPDAEAKLQQPEAPPAPGSIPRPTTPTVQSHIAHAIQPVNNQQQSLHPSQLPSPLSTVAQSPSQQQQNQHQPQRQSPHQHGQHQNHNQQHQHHNHHQHHQHHRHNHYPMQSAMSGSHMMLQDSYAGSNPFHSSPFHPLSSTITITIHGLAPSVTLSEIREKFKKYGKTLRVWIENTDVGMVTFRHMHEAESAIRSEFNSLLSGQEIKVSPSDYSAAPVSSVRPGDDKYWRCSLCHNTNRSTSETCNAYRCGFSKEESDNEWSAMSTDSESEDPATQQITRWKLARQFAEFVPTVRKPQKLYGPPHCLVVLNLPHMGESQVKRVFSKYGPISTMRLLKPKLEGEMRTEAQIVYEDSQSLERAAEHKNGIVLQNQKIRVYRVSRPFTVVITPPPYDPFPGTAEGLTQLKEMLFTHFSTYGVVGRLDVTPEAAHIELCTLRSVLHSMHGMATARLSRWRDHCHLADSLMTKWPCLNCWSVNPPQVATCPECSTGRPVFAQLSLQKQWATAMQALPREKVPDDKPPMIVQSPPQLIPGPLIRPWPTTPDPGVTPVGLTSPLSQGSPQQTQGHRRGQRGRNRQKARSGKGGKRGFDLDSPGVAVLSPAGHPPLPAPAEPPSIESFNGHAAGRSHDGVSGAGSGNILEILQKATGQPIAALRR
ncbi:hypothetical protein DIPPA_28130 [Diplonema papillatum]|nr:hypothetical protein DIPPA_28130 [Diplonema papillatum]